MTKSNPTYDAIVIGAGVGGIYQIKCLTDNGFNAVLLEAKPDLGGTWYQNRYPGCRFDSESYSYAYSFSRELIDEWDWTEHFSPQPENLKYLNFVADKFNLRRFMRFNNPVAAMSWDEANRYWKLSLATGEQITTRFVVTCIGVLSAPYMPEIAGMKKFRGESFHSFDWPHKAVDLKRRVGVIGTGATGIQIIAEIADKVDELYVFQRRPNWSIPLNNSKISKQKMQDIRSRYDEILEICAQSQGGFVHLPDRRGFELTSEEGRRALWDELYDRPGFALLLANFPETFLEAGANQDLSEYVAERIRQRVDDPVTAEKLIPRDHGFGMKRLPLETHYFEAYNRDNVHLIDIEETPIRAMTETGVETSNDQYDLDLVVYATGFHAVTGGLNAIEIQGIDGQALADKWRDETKTYLGLMTSGYPNMLMVAGPQSVSGSTNYPRAIEFAVDWATRLLIHARDGAKTKINASAVGEKQWVENVVKAQNRMPFSQVESWFTGYAPDANQEDAKGPRYNAFWGGGPKYRAALADAEENGYHGIELS